MRPLFLVTNDDGVLAPGLSALVEAVSGLGEVLVCAPETERSGSSHAITLHSHLRADPLHQGWWRVSGTPVDCVYLALLHLCPRPPALVLSGVNPGYNLGTDVFYSGTVGAAAEAYLRGVASIAVSTERTADPRWTKAIVTKLAEALLASSHPMLLNVNVPPARRQARDPAEIDAAAAEMEVVVTRLGPREYQDAVEPRTDPHGRPYYWIGGPPTAGVGAPGHDTWAVSQGKISVTPLEMDLTAPDLDAAHRLVAELGVGGTHRVKDLESS
jgi:5'-nucleotidase